MHIVIYGQDVIVSTNSRYIQRQKSAYTKPALNSKVSPFLGTAKAFRNRLTAIFVKIELQQRRGRASATASILRKRRGGEGKCERGVITLVVVSKSAGHVLWLSAKAGDLSKVHCQSKIQ